MTRLIFQQIRSETIQTRLELLLDDPPSKSSRPAEQPGSRTANRVPRLDASAILIETENAQ